MRFATAASIAGARSSPATSALLIVGLAAHLGGMMGRRRLDAGCPAAWWKISLNWGCWGLIGALAAYLVWRWPA
ncbi:hypothetical protein [Brevundimonas sp.]|uniref:hypothetical protein n=1 Tax=Brevundimonas sp. TaxID=1871086 RepID=UPI002737AA2C|nr:hypothetical protein [Brevundimonas sp.]MDP3801800.1 hypothetical protein [Brevundimonas sp.]